MHLLTVPAGNRLTALISNFVSSWDQSPSPLLFIEDAEMKRPL